MHGNDDAGGEPRAESPEPSDFLVRSVADVVDVLRRRHRLPEADAKDLAQDAWIRAQGAATRGVEIRDATAYLLTVALRLQRTRRRGEASRCRREALVARRDIVTADPSGDAVQADRSVLVWDPLALAPSALQVSAALPLGGANALEFSAVVIGAAGAIQTLLQAQVSNDGINWANAGSSVQLLAFGNTAAPRSSPASAPGTSGSPPRTRPRTPSSSSSPPDSRALRRLPVIESLLVLRAGLRPGRRENRRGVPRVEGRVPVEESVMASEVEAVRVWMLGDVGEISELLIESSRPTGGHR